jgi:hypothetical protein
MPRSPNWAREDAPTLVDDATASGQKQQLEIAADRLRTRVVAALPLDRDAARVEITEEQRANLASRPRTRRWKALDALDRKVEAAYQRHTESLARLREAEQPGYGSTSS